MIHTKEEIKKNLEQNFNLFIDFIDKQDKNTFEHMPQGKWSAGQNLDHLIKSTRPVNWGLNIPKFLYPWLFGKINRVPRTYDELQKRYKEKLAAGGTAPNPFIPPVILFEQKTTKIKQFRKELNRLCKKVDSLSDKQLDNLLLPHPLLGKLTIREMLFFTIYHTEHHLNILKSR